MSLDNYEIVKELGRGGMGAVFLANDKRLKRQVAIKVLKLPNNLDIESKIDSINNFKREAVAIANLSHNNIVCVYDIGNKDDVHYIVMELIEGSPLSKILKMQGQPFHIEVVLKIAEEMCDALSYIHKNRVIHRDIKPENIIYTGKGISKLTDFGISKFTGDENMNVGKPGDIKGTILYISPEQLQSPDAVDGRADMYSFAVSMYELLTGRLPFEGESPREVIMKILRDPPIPPSHIAKDLLPHIDHVIMKAMSKDPDKRYKDVEDFRDDLNNVKDFLSRSSFQGGIKNMKKSDEQIYSEVHIDSFEDVVKYGNMLPESGQQRILYEIEMKMSQYFEEYSEQLIKNTPVTTQPMLRRNTGVLTSPGGFAEDEEYSSFTPPPPKPPISSSNSNGFVDSLRYVLPQLTDEGSQLVFKKTGLGGVSLDLTMFLSKIDGMKTLNMISGEPESERLYTFFNNLMISQQKNIISLNLAQNYKGSIFIGDMLVAFGMINKSQIDSVLSRKASYQGKMLGEILVDSGYLTRDKLLGVLKIQHWYKRLFA